jgi:ATP citrate (pro-S)-lyase
MIVAQIQFESPHSIVPENYPAHIKEVLDRAEALHPWVKDGRKLVAKPDMLIKRRGKSGLLCLNKGWEDSRKWIEERAGKLQKVPQSYSYHFNVISGRTCSGLLNQFPC